MSCPFFWPEHPDAVKQPARAPLGLFFTGRCTAGTDIADLECCNFGYGRGKCANFPADAAGDAVRFNWDWLRGSLQYIIERDYSPVESDSAERLVEGTPLARQADVITAWLKR